MQLMKCAVKECKEMHKSPTGYCVKHADRATSPRQVTVPPYRQGNPLLYEERHGGNE